MKHIINAMNITNLLTIITRWAWLKAHYYNEPEWFRVVEEWESYDGERFHCDDFIEDYWFSWQGVIWWRIYRVLLLVLS